MVGTQQCNWIPLPTLVIKMETLSTLVTLQSHNMFEINNPWILVLLLYCLDMRCAISCRFQNTQAELFLWGREEWEAALPCCHQFFGQIWTENKQEKGNSKHCHDLKLHWPIWEKNLAADLQLCLAASLFCQFFFFLVWFGLVLRSHRCLVKRKDIWITLQASTAWTGLSLWAGVPPCTSQSPRCQICVDTHLWRDIGTWVTSLAHRLVQLMRTGKPVQGTLHTHSPATAERLLQLWGWQIQPNSCLQAEESSLGSGGGAFQVPDMGIAKGTGSARL